MIVLQTDNTILYDRLAQRGYDSAKIQENVTCEIMQVIADEARESYREEIVEMMQSNSVEDVEANVERICSWIS